MKCKWKESCGYDICMDECCPEFEGVPLTNADRIRSMTDEELAKEFNRHFRSPPMQPRHCPDMPCYECWTNWLKQPVEVEHG